MTTDTDLKLDDRQKRMILERCPDFGGLVDQALVDRLELKKYSREETFYRFDEPSSERPLRVIVLGHVAVVQRRGREQTVLSCGPMTTFGEEGVKAWNDAGIPGAAPSIELTSAITKSVTWVLELSVASFPAVFGRAGGDGRLLRRILGAQKISGLMPEIAEALVASPELADVDPEGLLALLEGAEIRNVRAGEILAAEGQMPAAFFVMLKQDSAFNFRQTGADAAGKGGVSRAAPACAGLADLIHDQPVAETISVTGDARVIAIPATTYRSLFKFNADFQRTIIRSNQLDDQKVKSPLGGAGVAGLFLVVAGAEVKLPIRALTDLLALSIATHLYDRVLVVHAVPRGARRETQRREVYPSPSVWVEHFWIEVGDSLLEAFTAGAARRASETDPRSAPPDVTLVDVSALPRGRAFEQELAESPLPIKVVHLDNQPDALPPIAFIAAGMTILYTAVLDEDDASHGAAAAVIAEEIESAARTTLTTARAAVERLASFARRLKPAVSDPRHLHAEALPPTWPRGAVRLRLGKDLIEALYRRSPGPIWGLEDLGAPLEKTTRATMDRWARAVTGRRVGLALGGGGTYGDMHVPLIRSLLRADVPIDMVSGSSVGSTVGAYFCARHLDGLDLYWKHRSMLLSAGAFGFITSAGVELAMLYDLGDLQLDQTEIPLFPVVTDADSGLESDLRKGTFAFAVRASGSLPPLMGPTVHGDRRYLDGGLVANVPVNVLRTEGADVIIASNPIARLAPRKREQPLRFPVLGPILRESHPFGRVQDAFRMIPMIFGSVGESQAENAHVIYRPSATEASLSKSQEAEFLANAEASALLKKAVAEAKNKWRARLRNAPSRVRIEDDRVVVEGWIGFTDGSGEVDPVSEPEIVELAAFLQEHLEILRLDVEVSGARHGLAGRQAAALKSQLERRGVAPHRITAKGIKEPGLFDPKTTLSVVDLGKHEEELQKLHDAEERAERLLADARREKQRADARTLMMAAEERARVGGLDLAGMLAIEAARLDRSPEVDAVLRAVLARRGRTVRSLPAPDALAMAWHPTDELLAIGSPDGLRIWDTGAGETGGFTQVSNDDGADHAVVAAVFSANGRLATAWGDERVTVHELTRGQAKSLELKLIFEARLGTAEHRGVAFSPDGQRLLSGLDTSSDLAVWSLAEGARLHRLAGGGPSYRFIAWEPDGERIAAAMSDGSVNLWSAATGEHLETIATRKEGAVHLAWHPRGGYLAIAAGVKVKVLDLRGALGDRPEAIRLEGHRRQVTRVAWSHDGSRLATVGADLTTRVWSPISGRFEMSLRSYHGQLLGAAFHPCRADVLATWSDIGVISVWDANTGEASALLLGHEGAITCAAWHPRGELLATASTDGTARLWDPKARGQVAFKGHADAGGARVTALAFTPREGDAVLSADSTGAARLWKSSTNEEVCELLSPSADAGSADAAWSPSGDRIATTRSREAAPILFDDVGRRAARALAAPSAELPITAVADAAHRIHWSPDGRRIAVNELRRVVIWDVDTGAVVREIESAEIISAIAWHPESDRVAVVREAARGGVWIHDASGRRPPRDQLIPLERSAWSVDFFAAGERLVIGCNDRTARVLDATTGALVATFEHAAAVRLVALSPDGRWLATGDATQTVAVWDLATGRRASEDDRHGNRIKQLAWSQDSVRLVSVSLDGIVCLWRRRGEGDATRFVNLGVIASPRCRLDIASFSHDGKWLVIGDDEGEAQLHPVDFVELIDRVGRRLGQTTMTELEWSRYMPADQARRPSWSEAPKDS